MKPTPLNRFRTRVLAAGTFLALGSPDAAFAAEITYKVTGSSTAEATTAANWTGGVAPGSSDIAAWLTDGDPLTAGGQESRGGIITLASPVSWLGLRHEDSATPLTLTGAAITLGSSGITEVRWEALNIQSNVVLGADQTWNIGNVTTVTVTGGVSGSFGITKTGVSTLLLSGANTFTGGIGVQNGTLRMSSLSATGGPIALGGAGNPGILIYDGAAETTSRVVDLSGTTGGATITRDGIGLLNFTSATTATGAGAKGVTLNGSGSAQITGFQSNGGLTNITKSGTGVWTLTGGSSQGGGAVNVNGGILAYTSAATRTSGTFTRSSTGGGVLKIASGSGIVTTTANTNGILGAWATYGDTTWAVANGAGAITGLASFTSDSWAAGNNTDVTLAGANPAAASVTHSLRFNEAGARTLTLSGLNTLSSGGILVSGGVGSNATSITGGNLITGSTGGDMVVNQYNTGGSLTIGSILGGVSQTATTTAASTTVIVANSANFYVGMAVSGTGIAAGATVASIVDGTSITLSTGATATGTPTLAFSSNAGLTLVGGGTTILTGANIYTGTTTIHEGVLEVQAKGGGVANYVIGGNGTLRFGYAVGNSYNAGVTVTGSGTAATTGLYLQGGRSINFQNNGGINVVNAPTTIRTYGTGNAILSGYDTGGVHLTTSAEASGTVLVSTIDYTPGSFGYVMNIAAGANTATGDVTLQGLLTGTTQSYRKTGTGSLLLTGASTATNIMDIRAGNVILGGGDNRLAAGSNVILGNGTTSGKLILRGINQTLTNLITVGTGTANTVTGGSATASTLTVNYNGVTDQTFSGIIGGTGSNENNLGLTKTGTGTYILTGANSYTGATTVTGGILEVQARGANAANYVVATSGTLRLSYGVGASYTLATTVNGAGTAATTGLYLGLGKTYTFQSGNSLTLATAPTTVRTFGTGSNAVMSGFDTNGVQLNVNSEASGSVFASTIDFHPGAYGLVMNIASGSNTATGDLTVQGSLTGAINGNSAGFRKTGAGSLLITGTGTNTAELDVRAGSVILGGGNDRLGVASSVNLGNATGSGKLILSGVGQSLANLTTAGTGTANSVVGGSTTESTLAINYNGTGQTFGGKLGGSGANENNLAVTKSGSGTYVLTGANTYSGITTVKAGTLALSTTGTIANSTNIIVGDAGSSGAVLDVSAKTGGFTIGSTQKLSGIGMVDANDAGTLRTITIQGTHAVGNSPGSQTVDGNLAYASGSIFEWDLAANKDTDGLDNLISTTGDNGVAGADYDAVTVTGTLDIASTATFKVIQNAGVNFGDTFWTTHQTWSNIFNVTGSITSGWSDAAVSVYNTSNVLQDVSGIGSFTINGSTLTWNSFSAVPEPTSALAGLLIGAGLLRRRRA